MAIPNNFEVEPSGVQVVEVQFLPTIVAPYDGILAVESNVGNFEVTVTGEGIPVPAPVLSVLPDTLCVEVNIGESVTENVTISNLGNADMVYFVNAAAEVNLIEFSPSNGVILPANQATIEVTLVGDTLPNTYEFPFTITANDPTTPDESVLVKLTVIQPILPPIAIFESDATDVCDGTMHFNNLSENEPSFYFWDFGDGVGLSGEDSPSYTYDLPGTYTVQLITVNDVGSDTLTVEVEVPFVVAGFGVPDTVMVGEVFTVNDLSLGADTWLYGMGDGSLYSEAAPEHSYELVGTYQILQSVESSAGCVDVVNQNIVVEMEVGIDDVVNNGILVYPNPVREVLFVDLGDWAGQKGRLVLYNALGESIQAKTWEHATILELEVRDLAEGVYFLSLFLETGYFNVPIVVR